MRQGPFIFVALLTALLSHAAVARDSFSQNAGNANVLVTYTRGLDLGGSLRRAGGIGGLLARTDANGSTFYHADGNGNITALMDGGENIVARYLYGPFGKLVGQWGPMANVNEMLFSSIPRHNLSGLSLYAFRAYDPNLQRWLNQDPIGERGGINLYRFVGNSPVNFVDPLGLAPGYGNPISGPNGPVGPSPFGGAGYGIGFNGPDPANPFADFGNMMAQGQQQTAQNIANLFGVGNNPQDVNDINNALGYVAMAAAPDVPEGRIPCPTKANPAKLRLPPTRPQGADPFKLANQMKKYGNSVEGMPPIQVTLGANGEMMINDGVTRATRAAITQNPVVPITVIENNPSLFLGNLPTVGNAISGK